MTFQSVLEVAIGARASESDGENRLGGGGDGGGARLARSGDGMHDPVQRASRFGGGGRPLQSPSLRRLVQARPLRLALTQSDVQDCRTQIWQPSRSAPERSPPTHTSSPSLVAFWSPPSHHSRTNGEHTSSRVISSASRAQARGDLWIWRREGDLTNPSSRTNRRSRGSRLRSRGVAMPPSPTQRRLSRNGPPTEEVLVLVRQRMVRWVSEEERSPSPRPVLRGGSHARSHMGGFRVARCLYPQHPSCQRSLFRGRECTGRSDGP